MDILRELNFDEVNYTIEKCSQNHPHTIRTHYYLKNMMNWYDRLANEELESVSRNCLAKFYTHRNGLKENCTIIGITNGDVSFTGLPI